MGATVWRTVTRRRDGTRNYAEGRLANPGLPSGVPCSTDGIIEYTRGHALFYWHPAETIVGHGPDCAIGHMLWNLADKLAADALELGPRIPQQRRK